MTPHDFIERWQHSGGAELANSQSFLNELCTLIGVPHPDPTQPDEAQNSYVFEKAIVFKNPDGTTNPGRIDLYRKGCFVLESKQGVERKEAEQAEILATKNKAKKTRAGTAKRGTPGWEQAMVKARQQAKRYAEAIPGEKWPPFLIVVDVGYCFDLYADFAQAGKNYTQFPDPQSYRIRLSDLERDDVQEKLRAIWDDPLSLDPSRRSAKVTRDVAGQLAKLARFLEREHAPDVVAHFLMRCLFTMFAEDVEIGGLNKGDFTRFLESCRGRLDTFVPMLEKLWQEMDTGGFSHVLRGQLKRFNGGLFEDHTALPVTADQLDLLIEAAEAQWNDVEPAIFGTLLERALDPVERHKLGAHYTPRAYVERLVMPTIIEPLREQWEATYAAAVSLYEAGKAAEAIKTVRRFHEQLCETRVLDPACGSGNFLYVSLELMKRLEGEVLNALRDFGDHQRVLLTIDPHQFLGIEINPRAAAITDLVLWIGYLQWHFRTRGNDPLNEPIIRNFHNIECRDAVLAWDDIEEVFDEAGNPVTRWDGRTTKPHPVTGEEVPDETARVEELRYINPRKAEWPKADYVVGNPPFVGEKKMRHDLGQSYVNALHAGFGELPSNIDYVMYWWSMASTFLHDGQLKRFGLITTKTITQQTNRPIVESFLDSRDNATIRFAIPNHPWVDTMLCAAVRIAMSVAELGDGHGLRREVIRETKSGDFVDVVFSDQWGKINSDFRVGVDIRDVSPLQANRDMCLQGVKLVAPRKGPGLQITQDERDQFLAISPSYERFLPLYIAGKDVTEGLRCRYLIDFFDLDEAEARDAFVEAYQHVLKYLKPFRANNSMKSRREKWWQLGVNAPKLRSAMDGIKRIILTSEVSEHRTFLFFDTKGMLPDGAVAAIPLEDAYFLGVLSSRISVCWALHAGGRMGKGDTPRYQNGPCFDPFPFPSCDAALQERIRKLGEQLDAHRKRQQAAHPDLTITGMYNVLEKLRAGQQLGKKERDIHEAGLVSVLKQIHDDLDAAVFDAYGWPHDLDDEEILQRLVDLNHERAAEEARGLIRWLRPEFQNPDGQQPKQTEIEIAEPEAKPAKPATKKIKKQPWPETLPDRVSSVRASLAEHGLPAAPADIAKYFSYGRAASVQEILDALVAVGQARQTNDGRYVP